MRPLVIRQVNGLDTNLRARGGLAPAIQGQLLRRSDRREVAIYLRNDALWIADFIDGDGELIDALTWFRFNCGKPHTACARRRMILESAVPLSGQLAAKIECLHLFARAADRPRAATAKEYDVKAGGHDTERISCREVTP